MTSSRSYLIRAMYQWISDNGMTPHLLVDVSVEGCFVPTAYIQDGKIVLNIAPMAIGGLILGDDEISFSARFNGNSESISVPIKAVEAIYARENGQGMRFSDDEDLLPEVDAAATEPDTEKSPDSKKSKPNLRLV